MGYEATCTIRIDGQAARGTAWLEHKELVFRGPFRVSIPLSEITDATAENAGTLVISWGGRRATLDIGDAASRWAQRIMNPPSRLQKLGVKAGMRIALINLDDPRFRQEIEDAGAKVLARLAAETDAVFLGAGKPADLERMASLAASLKPAGALWIVRRKGQTAVSERDSMAAGKRAGLVDVKVVSFSDTHTAEKYVTPVAKRAAVRRASSPAPRTRGSVALRGRS